MNPIDEIAQLKRTRAEAKAAMAYHAALATGPHPHLSHSRKSLYFALCGDAVKIGVSSHPESRMKELQTGAPGELRLIAVIPNSGHREHEVHESLAHERIYGEWFRYTPEVDRCIDHLAAQAVTP